ncbi:MAG: cytochrome ubiquinol oxidase subunit I [Streptosporangiales bacterium]
MNSKTGKPQLNDIWAVLTNPVFLWGYAHVLLASLVTGAAVMLAVSAWQLRRGGHLATSRTCCRCWPPIRGTARSPA